MIARTLAKQVANVWKQKIASYHALGGQLHTILTGETQLIGDVCIRRRSCQHVAKMAFHHLPKPTAARLVDSVDADIQGVPKVLVTF